jgi:hypothetical protein
MTRDDIIRMAREAGMDIDNEVAFSENDYDQDVNISDLQTFAALVAAASASVEPVSLKQIAAERGINMPENYVPTMDDAVAAVDGVLMNEQAALLRECRAALDSLIELKPALAGLHCGSTTLGNLKASLYEYRPQGVFGNTTPPQRKWQGLTEDDWNEFMMDHLPSERYGHTRMRAVWDFSQSKLKEKNT